MLLTLLRSEALDGLFRIDLVVAGLVVVEPVELAFCTVLWPPAPALAPASVVEGCSCCLVFLVVVLMEGRERLLWLLDFGMPGLAEDEEGPSFYV